MAIYSTDSGFRLNSTEISEVVNLLLSKLIQRSVQIDHGNLPTHSNDILRMLAQGYQLSRQDDAFLSRVASLAPAMMDSNNIQDGPGLEDIITSIGESFAAIAGLKI